MDDTESEPSQNQPKPPPIFVYKVDNIKPLKDLLDKICINKFELKVLKDNEIKIQPTTIESYSTITKALEEKNTDFHTFKPKQQRLFNVVLKGIHN